MNSYQELVDSNFTVDNYDFYSFRFPKDYSVHQKKLFLIGVVLRLISFALIIQDIFENIMTKDIGVLFSIFAITLFGYPYIPAES